jgi:hypothetical protein
VEIPSADFRPRFCFVDGELHLDIYIIDNKTMVSPNLNKERKVLRVTAWLTVLGLTLGTISWFVTNRPNFGVAAGGVLVLWGVLLYVISFLPANMRLENKPRWLQIFDGVIGVTVCYLNFVIWPAVPMSWRHYASGLLVFLLVISLFWPAVKTRIPLS